MSKREDKGTTRAGFINPNKQKNLGKRQPANPNNLVHLVIKELT